MVKARVIVDRDIENGKPIIDGTQIRVEFILDNLAVGRTPRELMAKHRGLTLEGIEAAKAFALEVVRHDRGRVKRLPLRIKHLIVALQPHPIVDEICEAFAWVRLGHGLSLRQMAAADNYGIDSSGHELTHQEYKQLQKEDETNDWQSVAVADLDSYLYFAYCDAEGFRFYIPARMIHCLSFKSPANDSELLGDLYPQKYGDELRSHIVSRYALLDSRQKSTIANFLWYLLDTPLTNYEKRHEDVEHALETHWMQFLQIEQEPQQN